MRRYERFCTIVTRVYPESLRDEYGDDAFERSNRDNYPDPVMKKFIDVDARVIGNDYRVRLG